MNVAKLKEILANEPDEYQVVFEIVENGKEPTASYSLDEVKFEHGFAIMRSVD